MTTEEVNKILDAFDSIAEIAGVGLLRNLFNKFETSGIPNEYRDTVIAQVKEDIAKTLADSIAQTQQTMNDPDFLEKVKAMGVDKDDESSVCDG